MKHKLLLIASLLMCLEIHSGQLLRIVSQTPIQGAEEARCLMFDHYGLMWICTDQGVRTFDGYGFKAYRNDAYSPSIFPNNYVQRIAEAPDDKLWFGTRDGLTCFNRRNGTFKSYHLRAANSHIIDALFTSSDGTVWVGTGNGVSYYDQENDDFIDIKLPVGVRSFSEDKKGNIYIGTWEGGLFRLNRKSGKLISYPKLSERNTVASQLMDSRGRLWIGTWENGIVRLDNPEDAADPGVHHINDSRRDFRTFHQLVEDSVSHAVWGCCIEGLTSIDLDDEHIIENHPELSFCYDIETDKRGNLWVLTRNQGIVHISTKPSPFRFYQLNPVGLDLPVNRIQTVYTSDGKLFWLGLQPYGLACYNREEGRVSYNNQIPGFEQMTGTGGINVQSIPAIMKYNNGELWFASTRGIVVWRPGEPAHILPRGSSPFMSNGNVKALCQLHDGTVLVGQDSGLGVAFSDAEGRQLLNNINVHQIIETHDNSIWIATDNTGIIRIAGDMHKTESIQYQGYTPANGNYPLHDVTSLYEDSHHRLWAISNSGVLLLYDAKKDQFTPVNQIYHLKMDRIYAINGDDLGRLWLSTDWGLCCLTINDDGKCHPAYYGMEDGLESIRFSTNGLSRFDKELFLGSANGFFSFEPGRMDSWQPAGFASLLVTELLINDRRYERLDSLQRCQVSAEPPFATRQITISPSIEKFTVEFALLTYQNANQCHYAYMLDGYDRKWHFVNSENRKATYQNLPAGTYELHLRALDSYGHRTELPYTITVRVLPPWYQTWWAYLIYIVLLTLAAYGIKEWYKNRLNRRARLQQRVNELLHYREMMVMKQFEGAHKVLEVEEQQHSSPDELFLQKAIDCVKQHIDDADYDREQFASDMCVSSSTLYNKLRALTGENITSFINSIRLKEACKILKSKPNIKMTELSMAVGFNTPKYFTKCFKKEFGVLPSEYLSQE